MKTAYMYRLCLVMFILSSVGVLMNIVLIFMNNQHINDYIRAVSLLIFSAVFYTLMRFYKKREKQKK